VVTSFGFRPYLVNILIVAAFSRMIPSQSFRLLTVSHCALILFSKSFVESMPIPPPFSIEEIVLRALISMIGFFVSNLSRKKPSLSIHPERN
jgi:hypothetical protein